MAPEPLCGCSNQARIVNLDGYNSLYEDSSNDQQQARKGTDCNPALRRQRWPQHPCALWQRRVLRLPLHGAHSAGQGAAPERPHRLQPQHGADEAALGRGKGGCHPRDRVRESQPLSLPLHGHLAHRGAGYHRHRGLAGTGRAGDGPAGRECAYRRQLRTRAPAGPGLPRRFGGFRRRPGDLRTVPRHRGRRACGCSPWRPSRGCTATSPGATR